jgi:hypothetical protein
VKHAVRRPLSRAAWTAGSKRALSVAMMAMTTSNSTIVKAFAVVFVELIGHS